MIKTNNANVMVERQKTIAAPLRSLSRLSSESAQLSLASSLFVCQSIYLTIGTTDWSKYYMYVRVVLNIDIMNIKSLQKDHGETREGQEESFKIEIIFRFGGAGGTAGDLEPDTDQ